MLAFLFRQGCGVSFSSELTGIELIVSMQRCTKLKEDRLQSAAGQSQRANSSNVTNQVLNLCFHNVAQAHSRGGPGILVASVEVSKTSTKLVGAAELPKMRDRPTNYFSRLGGPTQIASRPTPDGSRLGRAD